MSPGTVPKGSWRWAVHIAELTAWGTVAVIGLAVATVRLPATRVAAGAALVAGLAAWLLLFFRVLLPRWTGRRGAPWVGMATTLGFAAGVFALLRPEVPSAHLVFIPVIVVTGLLGQLTEGVVSAVVATIAYWAVTTAAGSSPRPGALIFNAGAFVVSGFTAGLLSRELRSHYRGEQQEHRLATTVRSRLGALLDAVDEAIVFSDSGGIVRALNPRALELFGLDAQEHLDAPLVQLLRTLARETEDPEAFMELFQEVRSDARRELRVEIEQVLPARRRLRLYSAPTLDDDGELAGRIEVYTDITANAERETEIAALYERARKTAESYQRGLLPKSVPALPRLSVVAHYVAAAGRRAVCGDFYDFITLDDGRVGIVMGDVCGVGPEAVNDAALARYTVRSFAGEFSDPGALLERVNSTIHAHLPGERFIRLVYGALDPERAVLEYANAGHVPPVVYRSDDACAQWLEEGGVVLGVEQDARYKSARIELHPGDTLVFYTDGVTEAPRGGRPFGRGRFMDLIHDWGRGTPGEIVQAIGRSVETWTAHGELRDDLALLICQVVPDTAVGETVRELVLPNEPARIAEVRSFVAEFLAELRAPVETSSEVLLAVGEAAANACRHGRRPGGRSEVRIRCVAEDSGLEITIADDGPGFDRARLEQQGMPDPFSSGGRGLFLIKELSDDVDVETSREGTTVTMKRALRHGA